jgi:hypothetical protein
MGFWLWGTGARAQFVAVRPAGDSSVGDGKPPRFTPTYVSPTDRIASRRERHGAKEPLIERLLATSTSPGAPHSVASRIDHGGGGVKGIWRRRARCPRTPRLRA